MNYPQVYLCLVRKFYGENGKGNPGTLHLLTMSTYAFYPDVWNTTSAQHAMNKSSVIIGTPVMLLELRRMMAILLHSCEESLFMELKTMLLYRADSYSASAFVFLWLSDVVHDRLSDYSSRSTQSFLHICSIIYETPSRELQSRISYVAKRFFLHVHLKSKRSALDDIVALDGYLLRMLFHDKNLLDSRLYEYFADLTQHLQQSSLKRMVETIHEKIQKRSKSFYFSESNRITLFLRSCGESLRDEANFELVRIRRRKNSVSERRIVAVDA